MLGYFKKHFAMYEAQLGHTLNAVRCDNGLEFSNREFEIFQNELGIRMRKTFRTNFPQCGYL